MQRASDTLPQRPEPGTPSPARTGGHDFVTPDTTQADRELALLGIAAGALTDLVEREFATLPRPVQRQVACVAAGFIDDLRAVGFVLQVTL